MEWRGGEPGRPPGHREHPRLYWQCSGKSSGALKEGMKELRTTGIISGKSQQPHEVGTVSGCRSENRGAETEKAHSPCSNSTSGMLQHQAWKERSRIEKEVSEHRSEWQPGQTARVRKSCRIQLGCKEISKGSRLTSGQPEGKDRGA